MLITIVGTIASFASLSTLPPQIYQMYKTKSAKQVSLFMLINFLIAAICWLIYGILIHAVSIIITNSILLVFSVILIILKFKYDKKICLNPKTSSW
ncbi:MAG: SemiSWEET family transporter [bacterium]